MGEWIELPYGAWRDTRDTLHMYLQIIGKIRHSLSPVEPDWGSAVCRCQTQITKQIPVG